MLSTPSRAVWASIFALSLTTLPLTIPASAQTNNSGRATSPNTTVDRNYDTSRDNRGFDWGWVGLLGLIGLAGLNRKPERNQAYSDPNEVSRSSSRN